MKKKAQVTIFIIIAIILIAAVSLYFIFRDDLSSEGELSPDIEEIYLFVEECLEDVSEDVIYTVGQGGGYHFPPKLSTDSGIAYYYSNGENYMPSEKQIEEEISYFVSSKLFFCVRNFVDFPEFEITQREIKTKTEIKDEEVILEVEYPIRIIKGDKTTLIEDFEVKIPVRLGVVYDSVSGFIAEGVEDGICLSCLLNISETNDLYVDMFDYDDETVIFIFKDENSELNDVAFEWVFANEY